MLPKTCIMLSVSISTWQCVTELLQTEITCHRQVQHPGGRLRYFNDRGVQQRFIFYTQKIPTSEFVYPQKIPTFLAYPKKSHTNSKLYFKYMLLLIWADEKYNTPKHPCVFLQPKKIPTSSIDQKIPFGQNFRPKKSLGSPLHPPPPSVKYVSGMLNVEICWLTVHRLLLSCRKTCVCIQHLSKYQPDFRRNFMFQIINAMKR